MILVCIVTFVLGVALALLQRRLSMYMFAQLQASDEAWRECDPGDAQDDLTQSEDPAEKDLAKVDNSEAAVDEDGFTQAAQISRTYALCYSANASLRLLMYVLHLGRYAQRVASRERLYRTVLYTSLLPFVRENTGNVIMHGVAFPVEHDALMRMPGRWWCTDVLEIVLDHEAMCVRAVLINGHLRVADLQEMAVLVLLTIALASHWRLHGVAGGVARLAGQWPLADAAAEHARTINTIGVHGLNGIVGPDAGHILRAQMQVAPPPLGVHLHRFVDRSKTLRMMIACERSLAAVLPDAKPQARGVLLAATLLHSADHYYVGRMLPYEARSRTLRSDHRLLRLAAVDANRCWHARMLCRERLDDSVCRALYETVADHDEDLGRHLFWTVTQ